VSISAQSPTEVGDSEVTREAPDARRCDDAACQGRRRVIAAAAARITAAKTAFVTALRGFVEGASGSFGDEGPRIRAAVADMAAALAQWDDAIKSYRGALDEGTNAEAQVALGSALLDRGRVPEAVQQFRRAVSLAPRQGEASLMLALAYEVEGKPDDSAQALARAAREAPDNPAIGYLRVLRAVADGDEGEISRRLLEFKDRHDRATRPSKSGNPATPFVRLGLVREREGVAPVFVPARYGESVRLLNARRYDEAVAALRRAVDDDPLAAAGEHVDDRVSGGLDLRGGRASPAIARLEAVVARWPDESEPRRVLAAAYAADQRPAQSIEQLEAAILRNPSDERSRLALAEAFAGIDQAAMAERALTETIEAVPDTALAYYRLGRLYQSQSRISEALAALGQGATRGVLIGRDALYETMAALRVGQGEFSEAIAAYRQEIAANPNNAAAHRRLGGLYAQEGRLGESLAEFAAALLIHAGDAEAHASRAQTLLRLSRFADAEVSARNAVALNPTHEAAHYALGTALLRTGRTGEGMLALQEFERLQSATRARSDAAWQLELLTDQAREHAARQDYRTAADLLRRAVAYAPEDGTVRLAAGALLANIGDYEEAIRLLKEAVQLGAVEAHRYLAEAYAASGRDEESHAHRAAYEAAAGPRRSTEK
jgi:tetratricopeptide (TPR) repeat protein